MYSKVSHPAWVGTQALNKTDEPYNPFQSQGHRNKHEHNYVMHKSTVMCSLKAIT